MCAEPIEVNQKRRTTPPPRNGAGDDDSQEAFIHRLPNELLVSIFQLYSEVSDRRDLGHSCYPIEEPEDEESVYRRVTDASSWRLLMLALLDLYFHKAGAATAAVPTILANSKRIRRLVFPQLDSDSGGRENPDMSPYLPLFATYMPALQYLLLSAHSVPETLRAQWNLSVFQFPALRALRLACTSIRWSPEIISKLTCLDIRNCSYDGLTLSCDEFLDVLQCCRSLRELRLLDGFVSSALRHHARSVPADDFSRVPNMPELHTLAVQDKPKIIAWLLSCFRFTPDSFISVIGSIPGPELPQNAFGSLLPTRGRNAWLPLCSSPTRGVINMWGGDANILVKSSNGSRLYLQLYLARGEKDSYLPDGIRELSTIFSCSSLVDLHIEADFDYVLEKTRWYTFLSNFRRLEKLRLVGSGNTTALISALKHVRPSKRGPKPPICPRLCSLCMEFTRYAPGDIELLVATLHRRAAYGLKSMKYLWMYLNDEKVKTLNDEVDACRMELDELVLKWEYASIVEDGWV
ncbi:hypothetical protein ONZ51_g5741 [Trametes cubensis]|uniref:F-box domain-containing protein n=1 Tax=Trametes cubensis TaxID=1111947 RepID=A0AAD7TTD5_9APHY|nr:hypothetical protein ONZ51_g5741 [Trametes cubensis]